MEGVGDAPDNRPSDDAGSIRVFMSYRRADDRHFIGRLHDRLCNAFGDDMVFRDIDSIPVGTNFRSVILNTLNEVDAVIAVIGPNWVRPSVGGGEPDYVFLELAEALQQGKPVIPALMEGTSMPAADTLPTDLRALTDIHAISVHGDPTFRRDSARLIEAITELVANDRIRAEQARHAAQEAAHRAETERSEREQRAERLRAEERAARARLAELEDAAARRQIDLERARLEGIAEQLRLAEGAESAERESALAAAADTPPIEVTETVEHNSTVEAADGLRGSEAVHAMEEVDTPEAVVDARPTPIPLRAVPVETAPRHRSAGSTTTGGIGASQLWLHVLIVVALVAGVIALSINRSVATPFNELSSDWRVDITVWVLTLAIGVPLLLWNHPVEQRFVLIGVTASSLFFEFLQASVVVRYGTSGYDEGTWLVVKLFQTACLVTACLLVRRRSTEPMPTSSAVRLALITIATACAAVTLAAMYDEWSETDSLVENGFFAGRTPFVVWLVALALGPIIMVIGLARSRLYGARLSLATIATLAMVSYASQAFLVEQAFGFDGTPWFTVAAAHALLATVAWWTIVTAVRRAGAQRRELQR